MLREKNLSSRIFDHFNIILMILLILIYIVPLWHILMVSLSDRAAVAGGMVSLWPVNFTLISYTEIMNDARFVNAFFISIQRVVIGGGAGVIITILMAYPLSKTPREVPFRNLFMWILIFCMLFNGGLIPWFLTVRNLGLIDTIWALAFAGGLNVFNVILVMNFFRNLPKQMEEAAKIDGAGPWKTLILVVIPVSKPVIATISLFIMVFHWNEFFHGLVLTTTPDRFPLQTYIQQFVIVMDFTALTPDELMRLHELSNRSLSAAKIFIAMIPVMLVYPFMQRFFIHGITLGSVKE